MTFYRYYVFPVTLCNRQLIISATLDPSLVAVFFYFSGQYIVLFFCFLEKTCYICGQKNNIMAIDCGKILREARRRVGVTQEELADVAGVSINSVKLIEQGKMNPTMQMFDLLMDCLGMEISVAIKQPKLNMFETK